MILSDKVIEKNKEVTHEHASTATVCRDSHRNIDISIFGKRI
jgi:hypothetical protein